MWPFGDAVSHGRRRGGNQVAPAAPSQTLDRGIRVLELLAAANGPLSVDRIAAELGLHRSIVYRMIRTLEDHQLVAKRDGAYAPAAGLAVLARRVAVDLQSAAAPELAAVAEDLHMTCFLAVRDRGECITLATVEPRNTLGTIAQRPGSRHPVSVGAPGAALLALGTPAERADPRARAVRDHGYATSHDSVIAGVSSVAVPLPVPGQAPATIAVLYINSDQPPAALAKRLTDAAAMITAVLS